MAVRGSVLVLMQDEARRAELCRALAGCLLAVAEAPDFAHGMAAVGRAKFDAVLCAEGKPLTMQGFCMLARKRHPSAALFIQMDAARSVGHTPKPLNLGETFVDGRLGVVALARLVLAAIQKPPETPWDIPSTEMVWDTLERAALEKSGPPRGLADVPVSMPESPVARMPLPAHLVGGQGGSGAQNGTGTVLVASPVNAVPQAPVHTPHGVQAAWDAPDDAPGQVTAPMSAPAPRAASGASLGLAGEVVLAGELEAMPGAAVLMTLLAQRLTGVMQVEGAGAADGLFCFYGGDPVWAEDGQGDDGLFLDLCTSGALPPGTRRPAVPPGELMGALLSQNVVAAGTLERGLAQLHRDRVVALCGASQGTFRFHEHQGFLQAVPLLRLNAFGLVLEHVRRTAGAAPLGDLAQLHVVQTPALQPVSERIRPLVGGVDLARALLAPTAVPQFLSQLPLAPAGAGLLIRALLEARLVRPCAANAVLEISLDLEAEAPAPAPGGFGSLPDTEVEALPSVESVHESARQSVLALYMRLKTLGAPHQVLGVSLSAALAEATAAHRALVARLDPAQVPPGPHHALLVSHLSELRAKVDAALEAMTLSASTSERTGSARPVATVVTLDAVLDVSVPAHARLLNAQGAVVVNARALARVVPQATLALGEACRRPGVTLHVAGLSLTVMAAFDRSVLEQLRGQLVDVVAPASCTGCGDRGAVLLDASWLPETPQRPPRPCLRCGQPARIRLSDRQRTALAQWLCSPVPAYVTALLGPMDTPRPGPSAPKDAPPPAAPVRSRPVLAAVPQTVPMGGRASPGTSAPARPAASGPRYVDLKVLGRGGMGEVVLARQEGQEGFSRMVALKRVLDSLAADREVRAMFLQEARTAARITHANVVHIYDLGEQDGRLFLAMEFVRGWDLRGIMDALLAARRPAPVPVACRIMADVCAGLQAAHTATDERGRPLGVVHRDVSAQNVLVGADGSAKVTDFGIAHALDSSLLTRPGTRKGKPSYMAPEQVESSHGAVGARTDVWAVGVLMHELLTGVPLFRTGQLETTLGAVLNAPIPPVTQRRADVPLALSAAVARALMRPIPQRHASAQAMGQALEQVLFALGRPTTHLDVAQWLGGLVKEGLLKAPVDPATLKG